ncbi:MAG: hypothetical protein COX52_05195 [Syntrophobacterales bacterium CG23_combo_of_CG06-09_8_20_14_all_48_27]|nr:MAG: hypothetical protein COX52_05195 [Syntrophobacterales bacterium CG23_combo_of_CG06-09_8_20_14_all_48_27]
MQRTKTLKKRKKALMNRLEGNSDFLIGSVVTCRLKCSKHCECNKGQRHIKRYLSAKVAGKTRNLYLPNELIKRATEMTRTYASLKRLLKKLSEVNYELLRATGSAESRKKG